MVGAHHIRMDGSLFDLFCQTVGDYEIVNPPACVVGPGVEHIAPPTVSASHIGIEMTEGIYEAVFQQAGEGISFFVGKTGIPLVGTRILQVNGLVCNVQIAAY